MTEIRLAPLAGVTDWPFRKLCFEQGCDTAYTEMVSATGMIYAPEAEAVRNLLYRSPYDRRLIVQIFGRNPEHMARTAGELSESGRYDGIDLNMGCPVHKVAASGEGSGLMRTPELAEEIMRAVVRHSSVPVSVKMRLGWDREHMNFLDMCRRAEQAGVSTLAIHGRTRTQMYAGEADWESIEKAAASVSIPVLGNGDIFTPEDAVRRLSGSRVAGLLIGRGAMGNPWIFSQIRCALRGEPYAAPSLREKAETALSHLDLLMGWKGEKVAVREMRKHIAWYLHGVRGAASIRNEVNHMESAGDLRRLLLQLEERQEVEER